MSIAFWIAISITLVSGYLCWSSKNNLVFVFLLTVCSFRALGSSILAAWLLKVFLLLAGIWWLQWLCNTSHGPKSFNPDPPEG
ncbi:MAG: hypothetical protein HC824_16085 [Synechococcales cyanobacterium RM1_1_8]|nr:hypothetical protein [Synechococcales cyanobacterium RM1_1_8]